MASRKNVDFVMRARDETGPAVRGVQRRFRGLGRGIAKSFGGNVLAAGVRDIVRALARAFRERLQARLDTAFDQEAEALARLKGATDAQIEANREFLATQLAVERTTRSVTDFFVGLYQAGAVRARRAFNAARESVSNYFRTFTSARTLLDGQDRSQRKVNQSALDYSILVDITVKRLEEQLKREKELREEQEKRRDLARDFYGFIVDQLDLIIEREEELEDQRRRAEFGTRNEDLRNVRLGLSREKPASAAQQLRNELTQKQQLQALNSLVKLARNPTVAEFAD